MNSAINSRSSIHRSLAIFTLLFLLSLQTHAASTTATLFRTMLQTTLGPLRADALGIILPHEHLFTDLRGPATPGYAHADVEDVARVMLPLMNATKARGVGVLVECSSVGVGRNVAILTELSRRAGLPVIVPTGVYGRAGFIPADYKDWTEDQLAEWMIRELAIGIEASGIRAGFIKLACDATPLTDFQTRQLRAAARASLRTGAAIAIHTPTGERAVEQAEILAAQGLPLDRFIWVHANAEPDPAYHLKLAARGVYVEFDGLRAGGDTIAQHLKLIAPLIEAGHTERILLSHDSGWYQPGAPNGGEPVNFNALADELVPAMQSAGIEAATIHALTHSNPAAAFAMH
jgi:phosphotriesterase-related protein